MFLKIKADISQEEANTLMQTLESLIPKLKFEIESFQLMLGILYSRDHEKHELFHEFHDEVMTRLESEMEWLHDKVGKYNNIMRQLTGTETVDLRDTLESTVDIGDAVNERRFTFMKYVRSIMELAGTKPSEAELQAFAQEHDGEDLDSHMRDAIDAINEAIREERGDTEEDPKDLARKADEAQLANLKETLDLQVKSFAMLLGTTLSGSGDIGFKEQADEVKALCRKEKEWIEKRLESVQEDMDIIFTEDDEYNGSDKSKATWDISEFLAELHDRRDRLLTYMSNIIKANGMYPTEEGIEKIMSRHKGKSEYEALKDVVHEFEKKIGL